MSAIKKQRQKITGVGKDVEGLVPLFTVGVNESSIATLENSMHDSSSRN
jgi:hypothetical protein